MPEQFRVKYRTYDLMQLGTGSFVDIYQGFRRRGDSDHSLLIKVLSPKYRDNDIVKSRFSQEYEVLSELSRVPAYFARNPVRGKSAGVPYLAYDFIEGESLLALLKRRDPLLGDVSVCCAVLRHLLTSINLLHQRSPGIVHSDISPENVLVRSSEQEDDPEHSPGSNPENNLELHLIDMGCSQYVHGDHLADKWVGKPSYLSPEQARGEPWGRKSDLYQAGIVFYELLTGERWNQGKSQKEKVVFASNPGPTQLAHIPVRLRPLLRSMLAVDTNDRLESAVLGLKRLDFALSSL